MTTRTHQSGLPAYLCLASRAESILAYGHAGSLEEAHAWCRDARLVYLEHADQVVLACPEDAQWFGVGRALTIAFVAGWVRTGFSWQSAEPCWIRLNFDKVPVSPTGAAQLRPGPGLPAPSLFALGREIHAVSRKLETPAGEERYGTVLGTGGTKAQVLLVSEDAPVRAAMRASLAPAYEVREAGGFADALAQLAHRDVSVVIAHHRPGAFGIGVELLAAIRERSPRTRRVLCAEGTLELRAAVEAGVAHHVVRRPLDREALMAAMAAPLRSTL
jgi:CheY-like chemotaxis protein